MGIYALQLKYYTNWSNKLLHKIISTYLQNHHKLNVLCEIGNYNIFIMKLLSQNSLSIKISNTSSNLYTNTSNYKEVEKIVVKGL